MAVILYTTHPNVLCLAPLGEISNVSATYDMSPNGWQTSPSGSYVINYTNTQYRSETPNIACPAIDSIVFTPKNIRAGVGDILTIRAYQGGRSCTGYWGDTKGNIQFRDANEPYRGGAANYVPKIDPSDITVWNDSVIKVKVPSLYVLDSASRKGCAGSGFVFINKPNEGPAVGIYPTQKLHIEYSAWNWRDQPDTTKKLRYLHVNQGCRNQYKLRCNTSMPIEQQRATFAAARAWNRKLGYNIFQINETPVAYNWKSDECVVRYVDTTTSSALMDTREKNQGLVRADNYLINGGFDIRIMKKYRLPDGVVSTHAWQTDTAVWVINGTDTTFQWTFPMDTINYTNLPAVGGGNWKIYKKDFYSAMIHELGHGLGLNHSIDANHSLADKDFEIMYASACISGNTAMRPKIDGHGGETLKGAKRILNDSKNTVWTDLQYGTFAKPVSGLSLTKVPASRSICGYGNTKNAAVTLTQNGNSTAGASYAWTQGVNSSYIGNDNTFTGQYTNTLTVKNNDPSLLNNINVNNLQVRCTAYLNSCKVVSDTFLFKASANVVLQPTPSRCMNGSVQWTLPKPTPFDGTFTAYNMATPTTPITNIVDANFVMDRTKFPTAGTYKIVYNNNSTICPIAKDSTYMSTFTNCTTLNSTVHKIYINEICRDLTAYRNQNTAVNDPCNTMKLYFTGLGAYSVGDSLIAKLSDATGAIDTLPANINKRIIGRYGFTTAVNAGVTGKSDSIKLENISRFIATAGVNYQVRLYLKRGGTTPLTEWGSIYTEKINFKVSTICAITPPIPCNPCINGRLAPSHFTPEEVQLYPNPTTDHFTLQIPEYESATEVFITDVQGRIIDKRNLYSSINEIDTHDMPNGLYFVRIAQGERQITLKLVVLR